MLTTHPTFQSLGTTQEQRGLAYAKLLDQSMSEDQIKELRASLQQQRALGGKEFQAMVEQRTHRFAGIRPAHRPRKSTAERL